QGAAAARRTRGDRGRAQRRSGAVRRHDLGGHARRQDEATCARRRAGEGRAGPERGGGAVDGDRDNEGRELGEMDSALRIGRAASRTVLEYLLILAIFLGS